MDCPSSFPRFERASPNVDVYRGPSGWLCKVDLAGVSPEDVRVELRRCAIVVSGVRRDVQVGQGWRHYSLEISYSRFERVIELPEDLSGAQMHTVHRAGMLLVLVETSAPAAKARGREARKR